MPCISTKQLGCSSGRGHHRKLDRFCLDHTNTFTSTVLVRRSAKLPHSYSSKHAEQTIRMLGAWLGHSTEKQVSDVRWFSIGLSLQREP